MPSIKEVPPVPVAKNWQLTLTDMEARDLGIILAKAQTRGMLDGNAPFIPNVLEIKRVASRKSTKEEHLPFG